MSAGGSLDPQAQKSWQDSVVMTRPGGTSRPWLQGAGRRISARLSASTRAAAAAIAERGNCCRLTRTCAQKAAHRAISHRPAPLPPSSSLSRSVPSDWPFRKVKSLRTWAPKAAPWPPLGDACECIVRVKRWRSVFRSGVLQNATNEPLSAHFRSDTKYGRLVGQTLEQAPTSC